MEAQQPTDGQVVNEILLQRDIALIAEAAAKVRDAKPTIMGILNSSFAAFLPIFKVATVLGTNAGMEPLEAAVFGASAQEQWGENVNGRFVGTMAPVLEFMRRSTKVRTRDELAAIIGSDVMARYPEEERVGRALEFQLARQQGIVFVEHLFGEDATNETALAKLRQAVATIATARPQTKEEPQVDSGNIVE